MQVVDYLYYEGTLVIGVHTPRLNPAPATVFLAGTLHAEYGADVREALREYKAVENLSSGLQAYLPQFGGLPLYGVRKLQPAGSLRSVDQDFNLEVTQLRFTVGLALTETTFLQPPEIRSAYERHFEKATYDLFQAVGIPNATIPGDTKQLGETYIDIMFELGPALEQGEITVGEEG